MPEKDPLRERIEELGRRNYEYQEGAESNGTPTAPVRERNTNTPLPPPPQHEPHKRSK